MKTRSQNDRIKIIYVIGSLQLGGAERQLVELATRLDRTRFEVEICCIAQGGPLVEYVEEHAIKVRIFNFYLRLGKYNPLSYVHLVREFWRIFRYFAQSRPVIIHAYLYTAYVVGVMCGRLARVPVTIASRRSLGYFKDNNPLKQHIENIINIFTHHVLVNSEAVKRDVLKREKIKPDKISLIYNGVDVERFLQEKGEREAVRRELGIPEHCLSVGVVANLIHYKGHKELVEAARILKHRFGDVRLVFVGRDSGIKGELEELIRSYTIEDIIIFTSDRKDIPRLIQGFDIMCLASHEEGFSNVILESMASGKPVVATDVGGNPEAVVDGETGIIVSPRDPESLAEGLLKLLKDPELRQRMGQNGLKRVREHFSIEQLIANMENFYLSILKK